MRVAIVALFLAAGLLQGWADWRATIGEGYAFRLTPLGAALEAGAPERSVRFAAWAKEGPAWLGSTSGALASVPLALLLLGVAAALWTTRRRRWR